MNSRSDKVAMARAIAQHLDTVEHSHLLGACAEVRLPYTTAKLWLRHPDPPDDVAEFQSIVVAALDRARRRDLDDYATEFGECADTRASAVVNRRKHLHEIRFKRFYTHDDEPSQVELSGPNGEPIKTEGANDREAAAEALRDYIAANPTMREALLGKK